MSDAALGAAEVLGAIIAYGTFGVPIKSRRLSEAQVHPLVIQGYKSLACFATCWLALLVAPLRFTWWGTVGALIWVGNGVAAIVAIQSAGLAVSQALWSGLSVFVAFIWGAAVFHEHVGNLPLAVFGLALMAAGMMSIGAITSRAASAASSASTSAGKAPLRPGEPDAEAQHLIPEGGPTPSRQRNLPEGPGPPPSLGYSDLDGVPPPGSPQLPVPFLAAADTLPPAAASTLEGVAPEQRQASAVRQLRCSYGAGVACAAYVGVANGSFLVPLKYANRSVTGLEYVLSFGIGAALVTAAVAAGYSLVAARMAWQPLRLQWRAAAPPALLAGLLWSAGNFLSILATQDLGLALAWPAVQAQLLVSTAWGAGYYGEVRGRMAAAGLLAAAAAVVGGVACLAAAKGSA